MLTPWKRLRPYGILELRCQLFHIIGLDRISQVDDLPDISELLGMAKLDLKTANGTDLPYKGWVELEFSLVEGASEQYNIIVPFRVAKDSLDMPCRL